MKHDLLRRSLIANAAFSVVSGGAAVLFAAPLASWIGVANAAAIRSLGPGLILFAAFVFLTARSVGIPRRRVVAICAMDAGWVIGTAVLLAGWPSLLNGAGTALVLAIALVVGSLALGQWLGLRRVWDAPKPA